jgi:hypothetical protein
MAHPHCTRFSAVVLSLMLSGCATTVTRLHVMPATEAIHQSPGGTVVSVSRGGRRLPGAAGALGPPTSTDPREVASIAASGSTRIPVFADDVVAVERVYAENDEVPGEGIVRLERSPGMIVGGGATVLAGGTLAALGGLAATSPIGGGSTANANQGGALVIAVSGAVLAAAGVAMLAAGLVPSATIERHSVAILPAFGAQHAGGTLSFEF